MFASVFLLSSQSFVFWCLCPSKKYFSGAFSLCLVSWCV